MSVAPRLLCLVPLFAFAALLPAADPPPWKVPASWKKVADMQGPAKTRIDTLLARDGYLVWMESRLDEATKMHRAQSHHLDLYRLKLGGGKVENTSKTLTTKGRLATIGPDGAIAVSRNFPADKILMPGQPPVDLHFSKGLYAKSFVEGGLLCLKQLYSTEGRNYDSSLVLVPIRDGTAFPEKATQLTKTQRGSLGYEGYTRAPAFLTRDRLVYAQQGFDATAKDNGKEHPGPMRAIVRDRRTDRVVASYDGHLLHADESRVFLISHRGRNMLLEMGDMTAATPKRLVLEDVEDLISMKWPNLLGVFGKKGGTQELIRRNFVTGEETVFAMSAPTNTGFDRWSLPRLDMPRVFRDSTLAYGSEGYIPVAEDATTGKVYAAAKGAVYEVPVKETRKGTPPAWE